MAECKYTAESGNDENGNALDDFGLISQTIFVDDLYVLICSETDRKGKKKVKKCSITSINAVKNKSSFSTQLNLKRYS